MNTNGLKELFDRHDRLQDMLLDLLAILHRDGGQYTYENGLTKSFEDACKIASDLVVK